MTVTLTDDTTAGPFTLPAAPKGDTGRGIQSITAANFALTVTYTDSTTAGPFQLRRGQAGVGITGITVTGGQMTVELTDGSTEGRSPCLQAPRATRRRHQEHRRGRRRADGHAHGRQLRKGLSHCRPAPPARTPRRFTRSPAARRLPTSARWATSLSSCPAPRARTVGEDHGHPLGEADRRHQGHGQPVRHRRRRAHPHRHRGQELDHSEQRLHGDGRQPLAAVVRSSHAAGDRGPVRGAGADELRRCPRGSTYMSAPPDGTGDTF